MGRIRQNEESLIAEVAALTSDAPTPIALLRLSYDEIELLGPEIVGFLDRLASALETYSDVMSESQATTEIDRAGSELVSAQSALQDSTCAH